MATLQQIAEVRNNTKELSNTPPYTDDYISALIDQYGVTQAELKIWIEKRNAVAELVDISEGGSSRKNSQLFDQYSKIVASYGADSSSIPSTAGRPRTRKIVRG